MTDHIPPSPLDELQKLRDRKGAQSLHAARVAKLFAEHNRSLIAFLYSRLHSLADAQEIAQEAYVRLLRMEETEGVDLQSALLFRIAINLSIDRIRARRVREQVETEETSGVWESQRQSEDPAMEFEKVRIVQRALAELPAKTSRAFVLHVLEGNDIRSIAQTLRISARMVRYHVANALAYCRMRVNEGDRS